MEVCEMAEENAVMPDPSALIALNRLRNIKENANFVDECIVAAADENDPQKFESEFAVKIFRDTLIELRDLSFAVDKLLNNRNKTLKVAETLKTWRKLLTDMEHGLAAAELNPNDHKI